MTASIPSTCLVGDNLFVVDNDGLEVGPYPWCASLPIASLLGSTVSPKAIQHVVIVVLVLEHDQDHLATGPSKCVLHRFSSALCRQWRCYAWK